MVSVSSKADRAAMENGILAEVGPPVLTMTFEEMNVHKGGAVVRGRGIRLTRS